MFVIFDFDKTMIDCDCDFFLINSLSPTVYESMIAQYEGAYFGKWNELMRNQMHVFFDEGIRPADVLRIIDGIDIHPVSFILISLVLPSAPLRPPHPLKLV